MHSLHQPSVLQGDHSLESPPEGKDVEDAALMVETMECSATSEQSQEAPILVINSIQPAPLGNQPDSRPVQLYFPNLINIRRDPITMLGSPLTRLLHRSDLAQQAIQELLQGPSDRERLQGFFQDDDVKALCLTALHLSSQGAASVVLEAPAGFQFKNINTPQRLDAQIRRTLQQFGSIRDVDVSVQGPNRQVIWTSP